MPSIHPPVSATCPGRLPPDQGCTAETQQHAGLPLLYGSDIGTIVRRPHHSLSATRARTGRAAGSRPEMRRGSSEAPIPRLGQHLVFHCDPGPCRWGEAGVGGRPVTTSGSCLALVPDGALRQQVGEKVRMVLLSGIGSDRQSREVPHTPSEGLWGHSRVRINGWTKS